MELLRQRNSYLAMNDLGAVCEQSTRKFCRLEIDHIAEDRACPSAKLQNAEPASQDSIPGDATTGWDRAELQAPVLRVLREEHRYVG
jgi:hypothetical protein